MAILLKTASVRVSSIQIMQVRVQNKGKSVWKSRYDGDVSASHRAFRQRHSGTLNESTNVGVKTGGSRVGCPELCV